MKVIKFIKQYNNHNIDDIVTVVDKLAFQLIREGKADFVNQQDYLMEPENSFLPSRTRAYRCSPKIS